MPTLNCKLQRVFINYDKIKLKRGVNKVTDEELETLKANKSFVYQVKQNKIEILPDPPVSKTTRKPKSDG